MIVSTVAKRKSNRAARHTLAQGKHAQIYRVSNWRQMNQIFDDQPGLAWQTKPSARQNRARKNVYDFQASFMAIAATTAEAQEKAQ